jgi:hypothetical protein
LIDVSSAAVLVCSQRVEPAVEPHFDDHAQQFFPLSRHGQFSKGVAGENAKAGFLCRIRCQRLEPFPIGRLGEESFPGPFDGSLVTGLEKSQVVAEKQVVDRVSRRIAIRRVSGRLRSHSRRDAEADERGKFLQHATSPFQRVIASTSASARIAVPKSPKARPKAETALPLT